MVGRGNPVYTRVVGGIPLYIPGWWEGYPYVPLLVYAPLYTPGICTRTPLGTPLSATVLGDTAATDAVRDGYSAVERDIAELTVSDGRVTVGVAHHPFHCWTSFCHPFHCWCSILGSWPLCPTVVDHVAKRGHPVMNTRFTVGG